MLSRLSFLVAKNATPAVNMTAVGLNKMIHSLMSNSTDEVKDDSLKVPLLFVGTFMALVCCIGCVCAKFEVPLRKVREEQEARKKPLQEVPDLVNGDDVEMRAISYFLMSP